MRYWFDRFTRRSLHAIFMTFLIALFAHADEAKMLVRLHPSSAIQLEHIQAMNLEIVSEIPSPELMDALVTESQFKEIEDLGIRKQVLLTSEKVQMAAKNAKIAKKEMLIDPVFHTYEELGTELDSLARAYPLIAMLDTIGYSQQEGRTIWAFKISDSVHVEEDEPAVLYNGVHHACEVMGLEICVYMINYLLNNYGSDPMVTDWVNTTEIWFVPLLNPDGHSAVASGHSLFWRKNGRELDDNGILFEYLCNDWWTCRTEGVNLNRNYDFNWEYGEIDPWDHDYRGESPFSESENQALRDLAERQRFIFSASYHSYGEIVYYPWSWDWSPAPDDAVMSSIASHVASLIPKDDGFTYDYGPNSALTGMSANWFYGALGTIDFMIEVNPYPKFIPQAGEMADIAQRNMTGAFYLLDRVKGPGLTGRVTEAGTGNPLSATVTIMEMTSPEITPRASEAEYGRYYRMLLPGSYTVEVSKSGYETRQFDDVFVGAGGLTQLDVALQPTLQLSFVGTLVDDDGIGDSRGDGDGLPDPGETVELFASILNSGSHNVKDVSAFLASQDVFIFVERDRTEIGIIPAGTTLISSVPFVLQVDSLCPVPAQAQFQIDINVGGTRHSSSTFSLAIGEVPAGDVNLDGAIDILDVLLAVNKILGLAELNPTQSWAADVRVDEVVNVLDVVRIVNIILGRVVSRTSPCPFTAGIPIVSP